MKRSLPAGTRTLGAVALLLAALAPAGASGHVRPYRDGDRSVRALNILPPGEGQYLNALDFVRFSATGVQPDHNTDQLGMYESLVAGAPGLTDEAQLAGYFKDASFGVRADDVARTYAPRPGTTVIRDASFNVPHVYGVTRADTMFGAGYVSAEDRLFMMDVLRHLSRGRLSELLGASDANLAADRAQRLVADYTEEELLAMGTRLQQIDPTLGALAMDDIENFSAGVNAYVAEALLDPTKLPVEYPALQLVPKPWKPTDSIALATLIGGQFSVGGGGQLANDAFLDALEAEGFSASQARAIFDDFRFANDPEAPVSTDEPFPYNDSLAPVNPAAVARPDNPAALAAAERAALLPPEIDGPFGKIRLAAQPGASNALLVGAGLSATGRPLAVFGPQVGYYSPEILMEIDLHGPGVQARGAAFPGISIYVLLGRGADYGWSATTALGDHIDIRAVKLCEAGGGTPTVNSAFYVRDGQCLPIHRRTDTWVAKPSAGGMPNPTPPGDEVLISMTTERVKLGDPGGRAAGLGDLPIGPEWALVLQRATVNGDPVAFVRQRSSYGSEVDATLTYVKIHDPDKVSGVADLQHAFGDYFSFSFNWFLLDGKDIGFYTTGRYPVMADGVDPDLPFWGDAAWDWKRFLAFEEHPQALDPASGVINNWNNKQARLFRAPDNWFSYGPVGRVQLLHDGVDAARADGSVTSAELVRAMAIAATQDVRGRYVLPYILDVIGTAGDARLDAAVTLLHEWVDAGAHRRDLGGDGNYDQAAAVALMDALWSPALEDAFSPVLGAAFAKVPLAHVNGPGPGGSAFLSGWMGHLQKDLRSVLGRPVVSPLSRMYCGGGVLSACRTAMLTALDRALDFLEDTYAADPATWDAQESRDQIRFSAVGVVTQRPMHWQNRPTFQQVLEFQP